jgi:coenzyme F420-reducing hydrogenase alpha subunit
MFPEITMKDIKLRKFGRHIIEAITGRHIRDNGVVLGSIHKPLILLERDALCLAASIIPC